MTSERAPSSALRWIVALLAGLGAAAGTGFGLDHLLAGVGGVPAAWQSLPGLVGCVLAAPLLATVITALAVPSGAPSATARTVATPPAEGAPTPAAPDRGEAALRLLALFQQEGRFVDFIEEDLAQYSDAQIGSAVRSIHGGCRAVLKDRLELAPVLAAAEGATVTIERGFDPAAVRVIGNVRGEPPYQGVLRHPGWRSTAFRLPDTVGDRDTTILAPAEVEVL